MSAAILSTAMARELSAIERTGQVGDLLDYGYNALAFYAREKTLSALLRRGLIAAEVGDYVLTDAGREALAATRRTA